MIKSRLEFAKLKIKNGWTAKSFSQVGQLYNASHPSSPYHATPVCSPNREALPQLLETAPPSSPTFLTTETSPLRLLIQVTEEGVEDEESAALLLMSMMK